MADRAACFGRYRRRGRCHPQRDRLLFQGPDLPVLPHRFQHVFRDDALFLHPFGAPGLRFRRYRGGDRAAHDREVTGWRIGSYGS